MKNDFFDNSIRQKLSGHEAPVPADAWGNIQKGKRKKRPLLFFWLVAGLLLCGGTGLFLYKNGSADKTVMTEKRSSVIDESPFVAGRERQNDPGKAATLAISPGKNIALPSQDNANKAGNDVAVNIAGNKNKTGNSLATYDDNIISYGKKKTGKPGTVNKRSAGNNYSLTADDDKTAAGKRQYSDGAKLTIKITAPGTGESRQPFVENINQEHSAGKDSILPVMKEAFAVSSEKKQEDSTTNLIVPGIKTAGTKKKMKTGLGIDFGIAGFLPVQNQRKILSVSRTMETPLHKAEFTAGKVKLRAQPSLGLNLMLSKKMSPRTTIGVGLEYAVIKEYIDLSGEEVNTSRAIIQRLHNGNSLVNDTLTTVSSGIRSINAVNSYTFLSVPVSIRYQVLQHHKWLMELQAGIHINLQSKYRNSIGGVLVPQLSGTHDTERNQSIGTGFSAGISLNRQIGKNYLLYAAPYFQINPKKLYLQEMLSPAAIQRAGISFGISYRL